MKMKTKKTLIGWTVAMVLAVVVGVVCWGFQQVPTAVGPIATVLGWIVMQIVSRVR